MVKLRWRYFRFPDFWISYKKIVITQEPELILIWNLDQNKKTSKKIDDDAMPTNFGVIVISPIYSQFWAIRKLDSGCIVCETYIFIKSKLLSYKTENRTKRSQSQLTQYWFEQGAIFAQKWRFCSKKMLTSPKLGRPWYLKALVLIPPCALALVWFLYDSCLRHERVKQWSSWS